MSNTQVFYKKIKATKSDTSTPYLSNLEKLTRLDLTRMQSVVTDLWWNDWASPISEPIKRGSGRRKFGQSLSRRKMDVYTSAIDYVLAIPIAQSWPEFQTMFKPARGGAS